MQNKLMNNIFLQGFIFLFTINNVLDAQNDIEKNILLKSISVKPHPRQYEWQKNEFTAFIHFGVNTFTGREWGTGFEDPKIFNPTKLNTDQWCEAMNSAGMKMAILTVKHHDGFCLWQTRYTDHSVKSSTWENGNGDVLKNLSKSCEKYNIKLGVYLSPADLYQIENENGLYGNGSEYTERIIPRKVDGREFKDKRTFKFVVDDYNEYFMNQLFELLTEYGPVYEVWFDGAHPKTKGGQQYTYNYWYELIRELAPQAVIFGKGPDVRWCGNEAGETRESEWSIIPINGDPKNWTWPDMTDNDLGSINKLEECINADGFLHWYPAETNTSIRNGWFWRDETQAVKTSEEILDVWYRSVGGNTVFLLNIPPSNEGLFSTRDVKVLENVGEKIKKTFATNLVKDAEVKASSEKNNFQAKNIIDDDLSTCWMPVDKDTLPNLEISFRSKKNFNRIVLQEQIQDFSQRISEFEIEALINNSWQKIAEGKTVGYKKICRTATVQSDKIKIKILDSRLNPTINNFGLFYEEISITNPIISRDKNGLVSIKCNPIGPIIKYTTDGSIPNINSQTFINPISLKNKGIIKAITFDSDLNNKSEVVTKEYDICKSKWSIQNVSSEQTDNNEQAIKAIDDDENTNWISRWRPDSPNHPHFIEINLGEEIILEGFTYLPRREIINGTIKEFTFYTSLDGKNWEKIIKREFSNIKNNPVEQKILFQQNVDARFIKLESINEINENPWASAAEIGVITK
ncbi:MAG: alpha-L-fucosidase [Ignavibacteriae bacterium]|nr:alpha-L-fucosidase [Ignavibacteriota bacterium]